MSGCKVRYGLFDNFYLLKLIFSKPGPSAVPDCGDSPDSIKNI